jgi:hypothetical protein
MENLLLLEEVNLLGFLVVSFRVQFDKLEEEVLADLVHGLRHVDLSFKVGMGRQKWSAIELLESAYKHDLNIFD